MTIGVVIPNWNGAAFIGDCLRSLAAQTKRHTVIVVDNGSNDESVDVIRQVSPQAILIRNDTNRGFAGGVNVGIRHAIAKQMEFIALLNNDATVHPAWLESLLGAMTDRIGIVTSQILSLDGRNIDSTGDLLTVWGIPYPRGRGELSTTAPVCREEIFAASGGASLYRSALFRDIGLFDERFFAYFEDVDVSFRAQLAGWQVIYEPTAVAYHHIGRTSSAFKGFAVYQTFKNLPLLILKNVPTSLMRNVLPRFTVAYFAFVIKAIITGRGRYALSGLGMCVRFMPGVWRDRRHIQANRRVPAISISAQLINSPPPGSRILTTLAHAEKIVRTLSRAPRN